VVVAVANRKRQTVPVVVAVLVDTVAVLLVKHQDRTQLQRQLFIVA
jgi:hypothetical protein